MSGNLGVTPSKEQEVQGDIRLKPGEKMAWFLQLKFHVETIPLSLRGRRTAALGLQGKTSLACPGGSRALGQQLGRGRWSTGS